MIENMFTKKELEVLMIAASRALSDGEIFDDLAEETGLGDRGMLAIRDSLQLYQELQG